MIVYFVLVRCLYLKVLTDPQYSPTSHIVFTLIALVCVDDTNLNVLKIEGKSTLKVIELGKIILDDWKFDISISEGDLKLDKCLWTTQCYYWNEVQRLLNLNAP